MITFGNIFTFINPKISIPILKYVVDDVVVYDYSIGMFQNPVGAFIVFGVILAVMAFIKNRKAELKAYKDKQEKIRKAAEAKAAAEAAKAQQMAEGGNK